jgi:hypothetical protein
MKVVSPSMRFGKEQGNASSFRWASSAWISQPKKCGTAVGFRELGQPNFHSPLACRVGRRVDFTALPAFASTTDACPSMAPALRRKITDFASGSGWAKQLYQEPIMIAERMMLLGGVSVAMPGDVAAITLVPHSHGTYEVPVQISRLLHAHEIVLKEARTMARQGAEERDDGTNDLLVSSVIRTNEMQVWFVAEYVVDVPLVRADGEAFRKA